MSSESEQRKQSSGRSAFPAPVYRSTVLEEIFTDAKKFFLSPLLEIEAAHTLMLAKQSIMSHAEAAQCLVALNTLDLGGIRSAVYDGTFEDLFFFVEREIAARSNPEVAGKMHTARSRNDIDLTMYRMVLRDKLAATMSSLLQVRERLVSLASQYRASLMPAYTHNQPAQPTTLGHYLMAITECFERDFDRFRAAIVRVNRSPMGACAITTTGFPIDREYTASLLGFEGLQVNSYGAIASIDYLAESCSTLAVLMLNLGRFSQDLMQWSSVEFNYVRLSDGYVQISSIMPQKRNPVPLEHIRILASKALMQAQAAIGCVHNTPFTDMNDGEDDLQPMVYNAFHDADRSLQLLAGVLQEIEFNTGHMAACANANFLTVTELADTLVRETGMNFHQAHHIVSSAVKEQHGAFDAEAMATAVQRNLTAKHPDLKAPSLDILRRALDAANFVSLRTIPGGPAPAALDPEIQRAHNLLATDSEWLHKQVAIHQSGRTRVQDATQKLLANNNPLSSFAGEKDFRNS